MKKVIDITERLQHLQLSKDPELIQMLSLSNSLDNLLLDHLRHGAIEPQNIAAVLSHRLGSFITKTHLDKEHIEQIIDHCIEVLLRLTLEKAAS